MGGISSCSPGIASCDDTTYAATSCIASCGNTAIYTGYSAYGTCIFDSAFANSTTSAGRPKT